MGARVASVIDPWFLNQRLTPAELRALAALWSPTVVSGSLVAAEGGVLPSPGLGEFAAVSNGTAGAPRLSVDPGRCIVPDTANYGWPCVWPTQQNVLLTVPAANPRIDLIVARVMSAADFGDSDTGFFIEAVDGTPAASPSAPAVPTRALDLWEARVNTNGSVVLTDRRKRTRAPGGVRLTTNDGNRNGSHIGDLRIDPLTGKLDAWYGASPGWGTIAEPDTGWLSYTPSLVAASGTIPMGTGGSAVGRYRVRGKTMMIRLGFTGGSTTNGGSGDITTSLPPGYLAHGTGHQTLACRLYSNSLVRSFTGTATILAGQSTINPQFPTSSSDCSMQAFRSSTNGGSGQGVPLVPGGWAWAEFNFLSIIGTIEIQ